MMIGWFDLSRQREIRTNELEADQARVAEVLALGMQQAVWTLVPDLGRPLLEAVLQDDRIVAVRIRSESGAFLQRERIEPGHEAVLTRVAPIIYRDQTIGEVEVVFDTSQLENWLREQRRRLMISTAAQLLLSVAIIFLILRIKVLRPLSRLVRQSERLAHRQLDEPFVWQGDDELAQLGRSFEATRCSLLELINTLEEKNAELTEANQGLEYALAARSLFLANMSHELRTPLNSIIGFADILADRISHQLEPNHVRFLQNILTSGRRLLALINDVLDLSRIDAGSMSFAPELFDIGEVLERVRNVVIGVADQRGIRLDLEVETELPAIKADPGKVKQIAYHLLSNAVKFSDDHSAVVVRAVQVDADASPLEVDTIRIDVIDHGIGIALENQGLIFDEFRQVDGSASRQHEGMGLGLALVRRLAEAHGGQVTVESVKGQGSTFSAYLPVRTILPETPRTSVAYPA